MNTFDINVKAQEFSPGNLDELLCLIRERYQRRISWQKSEVILILQGKAICRRYCDGDKDRANKLYEKIAKFKPGKIIEMIAMQDASEGEDILHALNEVYPILEAKERPIAARLVVESELEMLVKQLPPAILDFIDSIPGFSYVSVASILGACGDLRSYQRFSKLEKRMGVAIINGDRQRKMRDVNAAALHGYAPTRRSILWRIGYSVILAQSKITDKKTGEIKREAGPHRLIYDARREYEEERNDNGDYALLARKILAVSTFDRNTTAYKAYSSGKLPPKHLHYRAKRYMEKHILKRFYQTWKRTFSGNENAASITLQCWPREHQKEMTDDFQ